MGAGFQHQFTLLLIASFQELKSISLKNILIVFNCLDFNC